MCLDTFLFNLYSQYLKMTDKQHQIKTAALCLLNAMNDDVDEDTTLRTVRLYQVLQVSQLDCLKTVLDKLLCIDVFDDHPAK